MGDKLESKRMMQKAGVPVVPSWSGDPPVVNFPFWSKPSAAAAEKECGWSKLLQH